MAPLPSTEPQDPLLTVRAALIFLIAVLVGATGTWLLHLSGQPLPAAVAAGAAATAATIPLLNAIIR